MMMRGLWKLSWIEIKVFLREPMGAFGTIVFPVVIFLVLGRVIGRRLPTASVATSNFIQTGLPIIASLFIVVGAVLSLVTIILIYREGGILKRLRATPLRPQTILTAQVLVKLALSAATLILMILAGKKYYPADLHVPLLSFTIALLAGTLCILSIGFLIASIVPTARFAQPIGAAIFYPMLAISGLFMPVASMPPVFRAVAQVLPTTYAVSLMSGIWKGDAWSAHLGDLAALAVAFLICTALAAKVFRWE